MLVLSRRLHEKIVLPSIQATIEVVAIKGGAVRLGIQAPPEVTVLREEIPDRAREWSPKPARPENEPEARQLKHLVRNRLRIAAKGLEQTQARIESGSLQEAAGLVERLAEDLRMLERRLERPERSASRKAPKALIVEDDRNERELLAGLLRMAGVHVDTAGDGIDALDHLRRRERPDIVLLDMGLPRCDGPATVRQIRGEPAYSGLKIYAVTGAAPEHFDLDLGPSGIDRWFRKPLDSEALVRDLVDGLTPMPAGG
jgi:carbon storage regulator CsrA